MSDHAAYSAALEPWAKKADRERKVISHVRWTNGHVEVTLANHEARPATPPEAGTLI